MMFFQVVSKSGIYRFIKSFQLSFRLQVIPTHRWVIHSKYVLQRLEIIFEKLHAVIQ